ncbi:unnamed protein product [Sphagnum jensenii]
MAADIVGDIQELRQLLHYAKRPRVQSLLSSHISSLQKIVSAVTTSGGGSSRAETTKVAPPAVTYTTLTTLSWDQDNEKVKICIPLEGAFQEKMVCARLKNQERREERRRNRKQHAEARARLTDQERQ